MGVNKHSCSSARGSGYAVLFSFLRPPARKFVRTTSASKMMRINYSPGSSNRLNISFPSCFSNYPRNLPNICSFKQSEANICAAEEILPTNHGFILLKPTFTRSPRYFPLVNKFTSNDYSKLPSKTGIQPHSYDFTIRR